MFRHWSRLKKTSLLFVFVISLICSCTPFVFCFISRSFKSLDFVWNHVSLAVLHVLRISLSLNVYSVLLWAFFLYSILWETPPIIYSCVFLFTSSGKLSFAVSKLVFKFSHFALIFSSGFSSRNCSILSIIRLSYLVLT